MAFKKEWRDARIKWFQELKSNKPCTDCGQIYESYCMDYDHIVSRGDKIKNVSAMVITNSPKAKIIEEIAKCDLVCILCHQKRTHIRITEKLGDKRKYEPNQRRNINIINEFKNKPCAICGKQYDLFNMQADHIDPQTKLYDICRLKNRKLSILLEELKKCQVLCSICHRKKSLSEDNKHYKTRPKAPVRKDLFYDSEANTKECGICHQIKNGTLFKPNKKTTSGLDTYCKECYNKYESSRKQRQQSIGV
jgi:hypothetical protein